MSNNRDKARHRRRRTTTLWVGVPLALATAGSMAYGGVLGVFGEDDWTPSAG
ncbi:hypothetical protein [Streptomyces sp. NPDC046712]|uniref:hypothetical protein n=1 Tax=Streptomyces sp. NPDC046712 TaxID=3154802 RepID=UPI0033CCAE52